MASSILMLTNPNRYGVIDIRVWQLLFKMGSVTRNPEGIGFDFKQKYDLDKKTSGQARFVDTEIDRARRISLWAAA